MGFDAAFGGEDEGFFRDEEAEDFDGGVEEAAGVVAEVEDEGLHAVVLEAVDGVFEFVGGGLVELEEADIADFKVGAGHVRVEDEGVFDGVDLDDLADEIELEDLGGRGATDGELEGFAGVALEKLDALGEADFGGELVTDFEDDVAGEDAGDAGGAVLADGDDGEFALAEADGDADAVVGVGLFLLHLFEDLGMDVGGVGVEVGEHALEGGVDEAFVGDPVGVDVVLADDFDGVGEAFDLGVAGCRWGWVLARRVRLLALALARVVVRVVVQRVQRVRSVRSVRSVRARWVGFLVGGGSVGVGSGVGFGWCGSGCGRCWEWVRLVREWVRRVRRRVAEPGVWRGRGG